MHAAAVAPEVLARAVQRLRAQLGDDAVRTEAAELAGYHDPFAFDDDAGHVPGALVRPRSVEQVQQVLRTANEQRVPVWPVSCGRNYGYGGAAPRVPGSIVLELSALDRVLEVDERSGYALLEPGVRFHDLHRYLRENGHRLWISTPGLGWGSVLGNALERGVGATPYGDHAGMQCGMEVVLPDGDVLRTGMGAMPASRAWQLYRPGFGPAYDGMFMQSNFGVVTKMGVWLMPTPECFRICEVSIDDDALAAFVDAVCPLKVGEIINSNVIVTNALQIAAMSAPRERWYDGDGAMPAETVSGIVEELGLGAWHAVFGLYGTEAMVAARLGEVQRRLADLPGVTLSSRSYPGDVAVADIDPRDLIHAGVPNLPPALDQPEGDLNVISWRGGEGAHLGFAPVSPITGADALRQVEMVGTRMREYGFDYTAAFGISQRYMTHLVMAVFDRADPVQRRSAAELFAVLLREAGEAGYGEYRTHLSYMDLVAGQYSFNDGALLHLSERIKDALDPNGILAPGKQGIWPAGRRR